MASILDTLNILEGLCEDCSKFKTEECNNKKCLVGYAKRLLEFSKLKGVLQIEGSSRLIPKNDFKYYNEDLISEGIASTCSHCKNCQDNHNNDCIISVLRNCLENTVLQKNIDYQGSVFMYLMDLNKESADIANRVSEKLR